MLVHSVRRVPAPKPSSAHRISKPPHLYSSTLGASARVTLVSETCSAGAPTVVSFTVAPTVPRLPSASKGAHSRRCAGSVSACQTFSGEWRSSLSRMSVRFSPSFRTCAPLAGPGVYCSRSVTFFSLARSVPGGTHGTHEEVPPGAASRENATSGVRSACDRPTAVAWRRETGDVQLSRLYAYLREEEEQWTVPGAAADDTQEVADEAE